MEDLIKHLQEVERLEGEELDKAFEEAIKDLPKLRK